MSKAVLNVKGLAYCALEVENSRLPPSINIIDRISVFDGFGIAIPTLELYLYDPSSTLVGDFGFTDATKIILTLSRDNQNPKKREFRVWGWDRQVVSSGPVVKVVAILDVPKWSAGSYCESFAKQPSSQAISTMASSGGLTPDVDTTADAMTWLNVNMTRNAFSEDVAMRGYSSGGSCMARVLTMDKKLRYKDIIKVITQAPKASFLLNVPAAEASAAPVISREAEHMSGSGVVTHWMNYGWQQHEHDLSGVQKKNENVNAPVLGSSLPINSEVKGMLDAARVTYTGFDPGTETKLESNLHENYEKALYQNLRYLALFSERMRVLTDNVADIESFDCAEFKQNDPVGRTYTQNKTFSGKYLVGGKSIHIKNGHRYYEVYDLYRPYVNEAGSTPTAAPGIPSPSANDGSIPVPPEQRPSQGEPPEQAPAVSIPRSDAPAIESAKELLNSMNEFDAQNPKVPTEPSNATASKIQTQNSIKQNAAALQSSPLPFESPNVTDRDLNQMGSTVKLDKDSTAQVFNE